MSAVNCTGAQANSTACIVALQTAVDRSFAVSLAINGILFLVIMAIFIIIRRRFVWCYAPLTLVDRVGAFAVLTPAGGPFAFLRELWLVRDSELAMKRGLDAVMYLTCTKYLLCAVAIYCVYTYAVLTPVHFFGGGALTGSAAISMANQISQPALTADLVAVYIHTIVANVLFYALYKRYYALRTKYRTTALRAENYTVIVREFDETLTESDLFDIFARIFGADKLHAVRKAYDTRKLFARLDAREKFGVLHEEAAAYNLTHAKRKTVRDKLIGGRQVDAEDFFASKFARQSAKIAAEQTGVAADTALQCGVAFVTFRERKFAQLAAQCVLRHDGAFLHPVCARWCCDAAPAPQSVVWRALSVTHTARFVRTAIVNVLTFLLIFFWMIPVGFASSVSNLTVLAQIFPFMQSVTSALPAGVVSFLEGFLPSVVIIVFFAILVNFIIAPLARAEGQWSAAVVLRSIFNKFHLFQVFNVFFGSIVSNGIWQIAPVLIANPLNVFGQLAAVLPLQANYFANLIMGMSMLTFALAMLRPGAIISGLIKTRFLAKTFRAKRAAHGPYHFDYAVNYARMLLVFLIAAVYGTISPLVLAFALIYYVLNLLSSKYNLVYVCTHERQHTEGEIFPAVFTRLCWSVLTYQVVIFAILTARLFIGAVAVLPLCVLQILFWRLTDSQFHRGAKFGPLDGERGRLLARGGCHEARRRQRRRAAAGQTEREKKRRRRRNFQIGSFRQWRR